MRSWELTAVRAEREGVAGCFKADRQVKECSSEIGLGPIAVGVDYRLGVKGRAKPKNKLQSQSAN